LRQDNPQLTLGRKRQIKKSGHIRADRGIGGTGVDKKLKVQRIDLDRH